MTEEEHVPTVSLMDALRQAQGDALGALGFEPVECDYRVIESTPGWRLRDYGGVGQPLLIVAAPIKRPTVWDLSPSASAVRYCLSCGLRVYLLEWTRDSYSVGDGGLDEYCDRAIAAGVALVTQESGAPVLMGHSLGGTFAAIFAALQPQSIRGLALIGAPLCFAEASSRFRDAVARLGPILLAHESVVPGSVLSQFCALASPETFVWSRMVDAALSFGDPHAAEIQARVERWALDEVPLSGRLVDEVVQWLYCEDRFCRGVLPVRERLIGPSGVSVPVLAVVNAADDVASRASVAPFLAAMPTKEARIIEYPGETGVGLPHLAILVGRRAYAEVWPQIIEWLGAGRQRATRMPSGRAENFT
jgi:polyhydroxyalkanoate synthase